MVLWDRTGSPTDTSVHHPQHLISSPYQLHLGILVIPLLQLLSSFYFLPPHSSSSLIVKWLGFPFPSDRTPSPVVLYFFHLSAPPPHVVVIELCLSKYWKFNHLLLSCHRPALWSRIEIPPCSSFLLARQRFPIWSEPDIRDFITGTSGQEGSPFCNQRFLSTLHLDT